MPVSGTITDDFEKLSELRKAKMASRLSAFSAVGSDIGRQGNKIIDDAIKQGSVEPVTTLPTAVMGVPVRGAQRIQKSLDAVGPTMKVYRKSFNNPIRADEGPIQRQRLSDSLQALRAMPTLPPNFPDVHLSEIPSLAPGWIPPSMFEILRRQQGSI